MWNLQHDCSELESRKLQTEEQTPGKDGGMTEEMSREKPRMESTVAYDPRIFTYHTG